MITAWDELADKLVEEMIYAHGGGVSFDIRSAPDSDFRYKITIELDRDTIPDRIKERLKRKPETRSYDSLSRVTR